MWDYRNESVDKDLLIGWNAAYLFADWLLHFSQDKMLLFQWRYCIRIENLGQEIVQLRERHWRIFSLSGTLETVRGRGVVGQVSLFDEKRRLKKKRQSFFPILLTVKIISTFISLSEVQDISHFIYFHLLSSVKKGLRSSRHHPTRHQEVN